MAGSALNGGGLGAGAVQTIDLEAVLGTTVFSRVSLVRGGGAGAVVKADAYELGAQYVAPALHAEGCSDFFVAHLDEGLRLRPQTPVSSIYILNGLPRGDEADCTDAGLARRPRVSRFSSL